MVAKTINKKGAAPGVSILQHYLAEIALGVVYHRWGVFVECYTEIIPLQLFRRLAVLPVFDHLTSLADNLTFFSVDFRLKQ